MTYNPAKLLAEIQAFADPIEGWYRADELESLFWMVHGLPDGARVVELGVNHGRSASVYFHLGMHKPLEVHLIDSYVQSYSPKALETIVATMTAFREKQIGSVRLWWRSGHEAAEMVPGGIDLLHIDGDHEEPSVKQDADDWLPKLKSGGIAAFHDYGVSIFPWIATIVDEACKGWEELPTHGTLVARRKP